MLIGVPRETAAGETRVAVDAGDGEEAQGAGPHACACESGAGVAASVTDAAYAAAGAEIVDRAAAPSAASWCSRCARRSADELALMKRGTALVGMLNPFDRDGLQRAGRRRPDQLRPRGGAAHDARAEHGRAVARRPTSPATRR